MTPSFFTLAAIAMLVLKFRQPAPLLRSICFPTNDLGDSMKDQKQMKAFEFRASVSPLKGHDESRRITSVRSDHFRL